MSEIIQYMVKDPQGNVYGPAPMDTIRQWIREGRITAAMQLAPEGTPDWRPTAAYAELQDLFAPEQIAAVTGQRPGAMPPPVPTPASQTLSDPTNPYAQTQPAVTSYATPGSAKTNTLAIVSVVLSSLGLCCCLGGIAGIILGVMAKKQIKESQGQQQGDGVATAGIAIGVVTFLLSSCGSLLWSWRQNRGF